MALSKHLKPAKGLIKNDAGGLSFAVSEWTQLERFLILGTAGGTYYVSERKATIENAAVVTRCLDLDAERTLGLLVQIRTDGRAIKQEPCILALALAASYKMDSNSPRVVDIRRKALSHISDICWTATQLFQFVEAVDDMRGWGETLCTAIQSWYNKPIDKIAYQMIKYRNRAGWTHQDLIRKAHVKPLTEEHGKLFRWAARDDAKDLVTGVRLVEAVQYLDRTSSIADICRLIKDYNLPREAIEAKSTELLNDQKIWEALLPDMPMTAMIRNLAQMTAKGFLGGSEIEYICGELREDKIKAAHVHPISLLSAFKVYTGGHGMRGKLEWTPIKAIADALEEGFYRAFHNVEPTDRSRMVALDVSGSMAGQMIAGIPGLDAITVAAAVAMITVNVEPRAKLRAFSHKLVELDIDPKDRLAKVLRTMSNIPFGGTNCALPMIAALREKGKYDSFEVYTDAETWAGPDQEGGWGSRITNGQDFAHLKLEEYRKEFNPKAKLVVVGMTSNGFTLADPADPGMLDIVGCDPMTPRVIADFIKNETWMN